jgi:ubiquinone/menaquinone biosynthesis C-methylase UbiE
MIGCSHWSFSRDIEKRIPIEDNTTDLVISNCVINLTTDKTSTFREINRILKNNGGRIVISDLVTDREIDRIIGRQIEVFIAIICILKIKNIEVLIL